MKKVLITLALVFAIALSGVGMVEAQEPMEECELVRPVTISCEGDDTISNCNSEGERRFDSGTTIDEDVTDQWAIVCMINTVNRAAQVLFYIMMGLVVGLVILGGFYILTSGGEEGKVSKGKQYITYAIFGVAIGIFAYAVPAILNFIL